jgi:phage baseplate assembly protein W
MLPYFGVGVHDFLFDPLDATSLTNLKAAIVEQMSVFEPLLQVLSISAYVDNNAKPLVCHILMTIKDRKTQNEYPFDFAVKFKKPLLG